MINFAREPYGVGSLKWLVTGRMKILMASARSLAHYLAQGMSQKVPEQVSEVDMKDWLTRLTEAEAAAAATAGLSLHHCTLGPGQILYTPPGYVVASCVLDKSIAYGVSRVFFTKLTEENKQDVEFIASWSALKDLGQADLVQEMFFATHLLGM